eukprot:403344398
MESNRQNQPLNNPDRFEKTVNLLLSELRHIQNYSFELRTDKVQRDPQKKKTLNISQTQKPSKYDHNFPTINVKLRDNKKQSRPDAELIQIFTKKQKEAQQINQSLVEDKKPLYIVIDAKFYENQLSMGTIEKTIEDMKLRKAFGIIICSQETKLSQSINVNLQMHKDKIQIIKLQKVIELDKLELELIQNLVMGYPISKNTTQIQSLRDNSIKVSKTKKFLYKKGCDDMVIQLSQIKLHDKTSGDLEKQNSCQIIQEDSCRKKMTRTRSNNDLIDLSEAIDALCLDSQSNNQIEQVIQNSEQQTQVMNPEQLLIQEKIKQQQFRIEESKSARQSQAEQFDKGMQQILSELSGKTIDQMKPIFVKYNLKTTKDGYLDKRTKENKVIYEYLANQNITLPSQKSISSQINVSQISQSNQSINELIQTQDGNNGSQSVTSSQSGKVFYKGVEIPINKNGLPNMRYKICKDLFQSDEDKAHFMKKFNLS